MKLRYDVIVVGGGHAGCEAAYAAARMGMSTLLISMDLTKMGQMSCNPSMGGIAKGQIVREIDALGGLSAIVTDESMIQFRMLNRSKGPAMWSPRAQCDRMLFSQVWRKYLEQTDHLRMWQDTVVELIIEDAELKGIRTLFGTEFLAKKVVLTNGTFLNGLMHVGGKTVAGGRSGDAASQGISEQLLSLGFEVDRMKTGTSARLDGRTIDFSRLIEQKGDEEERSFSYMHDAVEIRNPRSCYITHSNPEVHKVLEQGLDESPLFSGKIKGVGPRYCPSIEDKIVTFAERDSHLLFIEPEGEDTVEYYINGFSSSLPLEIQYKALRKVPGLEEVEIFRPGYAIEYDYFPPTQLHPTLETKRIPNLYFAGQINGTTGYEEAGAQGMMAGINAALAIQDRERFLMKRDESYIGVLIDDLVTKGVDEPYRMFTSRAEYRILLRQDNADERLTEKGYQLGMVSGDRYERMKRKYALRDELLAYLRKTSIRPDQVNAYLEKSGSSPIRQKMKAETLVLRPQVRLGELCRLLPGMESLLINMGRTQKEILESAEIAIKYKGYIDREKGLAEKIQRLEHLRLPADLDYQQLASVSTEARQKLNRIKPETVGQASRISGVSPADVSVLLLYLGR